MGDKLSGNILADKFCQVRRDDLHSVLQISLDLFSKFEHIQSLFTKFFQTLNVELADFLPHRIFAVFHNFFSNFGFTEDFFQFCKSNFSGVTITDKMSSFYKSAVIGDYSGELWEMP